MLLTLYICAERLRYISAVCKQCRSKPQPASRLSVHKTSMMTASGAPPADDIEVPTANPLQPSAETTYVSLVPGVQAHAQSPFSIQNGYADIEPEACQRIHFLSQRVLQLAVINAVVIVALRIVFIAFYAMDGRDALVAEYSVYIFFSLAILYLGVQGVRKKNPPCCGGDCCGYLTTFYAIYIVFAAVTALTVLIALILLAYISFIMNLAFLALYIATANYTRKLLDELRRLGMDATHQRRRSNTTAAPAVVSVRAEPVVMATVAPPPIVMDDSYTRPAPDPPLTSYTK